MLFTNCIWSWTREADKSAVGAVITSPPERVRPLRPFGTTVGPDLSGASPIYRPSLDVPGSA